jgi:hypothetical protein
MLNTTSDLRDGICAYACPPHLKRLRAPLALTPYNQGQLDLEGTTSFRSSNIRGHRLPWASWSAGRFARGHLGFVPFLLAPWPEGPRATVGFVPWTAWIGVMWPCKLAMSWGSGESKIIGRRAASPPGPKVCPHSGDWAAAPAMRKATDTCKMASVVL